ncbi:response regulator [Rubellimicrobium aerolatum]|uniref:Response regulator n=1 Tax=Rubellimicrobium aerolatum TaxID=490979 RepID=A0ABW0SGQ3_9RHOB|nr:response regulator [Rubellimicrobium aerolatum]MBP1807493.1 CheY-like chemotaxis protein [Rubellimicrobium aerolatum]
MATVSTLAGQHILVVEDDYFVADDLTAMLEAAGATVLGPAATLADARGLVARTERLDGAILDINLQGETVFPVANLLRERGIPFIFATGYDRGEIPARFADVRSCEKPFTAEQIAGAMWA